MKNFTLPIRIIVALLCIAAVIAWSWLYRLPQDIKAEMLSVLEQKQMMGIQRLDEQIQSFDQQKLDIEAKENELEKILPQIEPWLAEKEDADYEEVPCG